MRASPGTTHTFDIIEPYGTMRVIWPATGHGLDEYEVERIGDTGHIYRVLPGHHVMGALEWHQGAALSFAVGERPTRAQRLMGRIRRAGS